MTNGDRSARAVTFTGPRTVALQDRDLPALDPDEARVNTEVSAISPGTEMLVYRDAVPSEMVADETIDALSGTFEYPIRYGYSAVGIVEAVGAEVAEEWVGRRVFAFSPHQSTFQRPVEDLFVVPDGLAPASAALVANAETAVSFALDGRPKIGERVLVYGQGLVGLLTAALLQRFPIERLVTVDAIEARRERSLALGADASRSPATDFDEFDDDPGGADLTYELSGNPDALNAAIDATGFAGRIVIGSWYGEKHAELDLGRAFHRSRIRLQSSQVSTIDPEHAGRWSKDRRLAVAWETLAELEDTDPDLVTHRVPVERATEAYRLLDERPEEAVGVVMTYD
jgi:2-desacetyl-2-hydroxyethyl bacteriochlorophyllide A dehydrogenase